MKNLIIIFALFSCNAVFGQVTHISYQKSFMTFEGDNSTKISSFSRGELIITCDKVINCSNGCCDDLITNLRLVGQSGNNRFYRGIYSGQNVEVVETLNFFKIIKHKSEITYETAN